MDAVPFMDCPVFRRSRYLHRLVSDEACATSMGILGIDRISGAVPGCKQRRK